MIRATLSTKVDTFSTCVEASSHKDDLNFNLIEKPKKAFNVYIHHISHQNTSCVSLRPDTC